MLKKSSALLAHIAVLTASITYSHGCRAEGLLDARLSLPPAGVAGQPAVVTLTLRNVGDAPVTVMKWDTPFVEAGGKLPNALFTVTDIGGNSVDYKGTRVNIGPIETSYFITIHPGESIQKDIDLLHEYRFGDGGTFTVRYTLDLSREPDADVTSPAQRARFRPNRQQSVESNEVIIHVPQVIAPLTGTDDSSEPCDDMETLSIARADFFAFEPIMKAFSFMEERYRLEEKEGGGFHYVFRPHPRYTRWFGTHDSTEASLDEPGWGEGNNAQVYKALEAISKRQSAKPGHKLVPKCGCKGFSPDVAAHAEDQTTYVMHFCPKFFSLPDTGPYASKAGVITHEFTHYNDGFPGRSDYLYG